MITLVITSIAPFPPRDPLTLPLLIPPREPPPAPKRVFPFLGMTGLVFLTGAGTRPTGLLLTLALLTTSFNLIGRSCPMPLPKDFPLLSLPPNPLITPLAIASFKAAPLKTATLWVG